MICCCGSERAKVGLKLGLSISVVCVVAGILLLGGCDRSKAEAPQGPPVMPVKVQTLQSHEVGDTSEYVATIKSRHSATVMSDVEGWIFDIRVHSGQFVKKGDTLMEIDPRRQQATVSNFDSQRASKASRPPVGETTIGSGCSPIQVRCSQPTRHAAGAGDL